MSDKTLAALTAATAATGGLFYGTQGGADRKFTLSAVGAAVIEASTAAAQRTALGAAGLVANTFTGLQTVNSANNLAGFSLTGSQSGSGASLALASFIYNLSNSSGTSIPRLLDLDWNDTGTSGIDYGNTYLIRGRRNGSNVFTVDHGGKLVIAGSGCYIDPNGSKLQLASTWAFNINDDTFLKRAGAAQWQLGIDHATIATAQVITAHGVTTGTGADVSVQGGIGSVAGGRAILASPATTGSAVAGVAVGPGGTVGFFSAAASPVAQPTPGIAAGAFVPNTSGIIDDSATYQGYTLTQIASALQQLGILA